MSFLIRSFRGNSFPASKFFPLTFFCIQLLLLRTTPHSRFSSRLRFQSDSFFFFRDADGLSALFVVAAIMHVSRTFVFHSTETLLRNMEISSWQHVNALFLFQAVIFSRFYPPSSSSHSRAPATSVVWFGLERRKRWRKGGREEVCVVVGGCQLSVLLRKQSSSSSSSSSNSETQSHLP